MNACVNVCVVGRLYISDGVTLAHLRLLDDHQDHGEHTLPRRQKEQDQRRCYISSYSFVTYLLLKRPLPGICCLQLDKYSLWLTCYALVPHGTILGLCSNIRGQLCTTYSKQVIITNVEYTPEETCMVFDTSL